MPLNPAITAALVGGFVYIAGQIAAARNRRAVNQAAELFHTFAGQAVAAVEAATSAQAAAPDVDIVGRTIWGEARGGGYDDMASVANVIANRKRAAELGKVPARRWGATWREVVLWPSQFSAWNANDPNRAKMERVTESDPQFREALKIARRAVAGDLPDRTGGADHYHAVTLQNVPAFFARLIPTVTIGGHRFYRELA